jgi:hypothetical protein
VPDEILLADEPDFRMAEIGVEAAVRFKQLQGLTVRANAAQGRGELIEDFAVEDAWGQYFQTA